jgi:hypothetical protein
VSCDLAAGGIPVSSISGERIGSGVVGKRAAGRPAAAELWRASEERASTESDEEGEGASRDGLIWAAQS